MNGYNVGLNYTSPHMSVVAQQRVKEIFFARPEDALKQGVTLAAGYPHIDVGDLLGRITSTGKYRRYTRCYVKANVASSGTKFICVDAAGGADLLQPPYIVGEHIKIGASPTIADATITAIDNTKGEITVAAAFGGSGIAKDDVVLLVTADGSETARGVAGHPYFNSNYNPESPNSLNLLQLDGQIEMILSGVLVKSNLRNVDAQAITDLAARDLSPAFDAIKF